MPTYRTQKHSTDRILGDWILKERLAFNLEPSLTVGELQEALPERCKQQLGELKPTDNTFRKLSSGFNKVSDVWIELMRFVGVQDFSPEQAIFGTVSTFLDSENVRVKLNASYDAPHRKNSIEVFCLKEPSYQGLIRYEGERLSFPPSIFEAVINRRLDVYGLYCENLSDLLLIPGVSDPQSLLIAENNARLAEEHRGLDRQPELDEIDNDVSSEDTALDSAIDRLVPAIERAFHCEQIPDVDEIDADGVFAEDIWMDSSDAELEAARNEEAARDAYLEEIADKRDHNQLMGSFMGSLMDEETSDDAVILTSDGQVTLGSFLDEATSDDEIVRIKLNACYDSDAAAAEVEAVDDSDADAEIETAVDGHDSEIDDAIALTQFDYETAEDKLAERMADVYSGDVEIENL